MTTRTSVLVVFVGGLVAGCRGDAREIPSAHDTAARLDLSRATQAELGAEIDQAERRGTWREVRQRWEGQRLHWTVTRHRALCFEATRCNVAAFPIQQPAPHGWLPSLSLEPGEYAKIEAACGAAPLCELEFEGTLTRLELSGEQPTSVHFDHVRVVGARKS